MSYNQLCAILAEAPGELNLSYGPGVKPRDDEFYVVHQGWDERERLTDYLAAEIETLGHGYTAKRVAGGRSTIEITLRPRQTVEALDRYICEHFGASPDKRPLGIMALDRDDRVASVDADDLIEAAGKVEQGFADEYDTCIDCGGVLHYGGESYADHGRFELIDGEGYLCRACIEKNPQDYNERYAKRFHSAVKRRVAPPSYILDPEADDFIDLAVDKYDRYENGLHPGQNDDPVHQALILSMACRKEYERLVEDTKFGLAESEANDSIPYSTVVTFKDVLDRLENPDLGVDVVLAPRFPISVGQFGVSWTVYVWRPFVEVCRAALGKAQVAA